jgi:hypothetical protein
MTKKKTEGHGGFREGSGKPTFFRGKYATSGGKSSSLQMSAEAFGIADERTIALSAELTRGKHPDGTPRSVSRNVFIEALIRRFARSLTLADILKLDRSA